MKAWQITECTGPDGLRLVNVPDPKPRAGEVLVRIRAVSLNYRDLGATRRERPGNLSLPFTVCSDGAGEVVAIGDGVSKWKIGDRVMPTFFQDWSSGGMSREVMKTALGGAKLGVLSEMLVASEDGLVRISDGLSYEEAATLPCAGVTAWNALISHGGLKAGETVLTLGTGGVSIFALQYAKMHGARIIITSSSDEKLQRAHELGADETINYKTTPDWERSVYELTGKTGVDHVIELGGAGTLPKSLEAVRFGGRVNLIGVLTGFEGMVNPWPVIARSVTLQGIYVGNRSMFEDMTQAIFQNAMKPVIHRVFEFADACSAFEEMSSASHFGKLVIRV